MRITLNKSKAAALNRLRGLPPGTACSRPPKVRVNCTRPMLLLMGIKSSHW